MQRFNSSVNCANISNRECSNGMEHVKHCQTSQSTAKQTDTPYLLIHCGDDDNFDNDIHCEHAVSLHNHYTDCADTHSLVNHTVNFRSDQNKNNVNKDKEVDITKKIIISPTITEIDHGQSSGSLANIFHLSHKLGDGAFGSVWHGKSKLDSQSYAIKIIPYLVDNENEQQQAETFREVRTMAKMESHSCVVRYYTSWIEEMQPFVYDKIKDIDAMQANKYIEEDCDDQSSISHDLWSNAALSIDHQISLESIIDINNDENNKDLENISDAKTHSSLPPNAQTFALPNRVLIIQMELCENGTLRDWLSSRKSVNYIQSLQIFRQIVEALHHIHCYDVLHRDVKPSNVFLCKNDRIKLGDFGLSIFQKHRDLSANSKEISRDCDDTVSSNNNNNKGNDLTFGLGTHTYGAPEQLNSVKLKNKQTYSKQADIYPLGLIAYELLNSFSTGMERVICINELKNTQKTSDQFRQKFNRMAYLIEAMISLNAENRPTTNDILEVLNLEWTEHQIEMPMFSRNNSMSLSMRSSGLEFAADLNSSSNFKHLSKHSSFVFNECKVKELEQELIAKDEQIEFLMERISKLEMEKMTQ